MAGIAASAIKTQFGRAYKGVDDTYFYLLLTEVDKIIVRHFGFRKKELWLPVAEGTGTLDLPAGVAWIEAVRWVGGPHATPDRLAGSLLDETSVDAEDVHRGDWRRNSPGTPLAWMQEYDLTEGKLRLDRPPTETTLIATGATTADPIVVTTDAAHGLADGDRVDIKNGTTMTAINGSHYAKVTGYSTTTFALYSDEDLTAGVAGVGAYDASSAIVICDGSPAIQLFSRWHETLTSNSVLPDTLLLRNLYSDGCCFLYAKYADQDNVPKWKALFEDVIAEQAAITHQRGRVPPEHTFVLAREEGYIQSQW